MRTAYYIVFFSLSLTFHGHCQEQKKSLLKNGKVDVLFTANDNVTTQNLILWTPLVKAGFGVIYRGDNSNSIYGGAYLRPLQITKSKDEWIIGFNFVNHSDERTDYEIQTEYRFNFGLGLGAGIVNNTFFESPAGPERENDYFLKASYRKKIGAWNAIVNGQMQEVADETSLGSFVAVYNPNLSLAGGYDKEAWRGSIGFISNKKEDSKYRLAIEGLYIDKTIGDNEIAPKILWINGTIGYKGGFLSHGARLGRAMGPTGIEFGNPLGYLVPLNDGNPLFPGPPAIWNRALNVWEIGTLINARVFQLYLPNGSNWGRGEMVIFPFQFNDEKQFVDGIFVGGMHFYNTKIPDSGSINNTGAMLGIIQRVKNLQVNIQVEHFFDTKTSNLNVGIINWL